MKALVLIDMQKAFTTGGWARCFGGPRNVSDIVRASNKIAELFRSGSLEGRPVLCTKCYLDGLDTLVIGGCTTTSCVRVSSQQALHTLALFGLQGQVRVVVDLSLCGARSDNFDKNAHTDPVLVGIYGHEMCVGKSAVDLAVLQMRTAGVDVVAASSWQC